MNFLDEIYTAEQSIIFTLQVEENNELTVLDILIQTTGANLS